jgi:chromatin remodeling complex protein RSC6
MEYFTSFLNYGIKSTLSSTELMNELCSNQRRICITKELLNYIKMHNLQDKNDTNSVILNDTLADYFKCEVGQKLTYYKMQELIDLNKPFDTNPFKILLKLSDDLCKFLGVEPNSKLSRLDVTKKLGNYIETHHLQDENNNRIIILNDKLAQLFNCEVGQQFVYYDLQRLIQPHVSYYHNIV